MADQTVIRFETDEPAGSGLVPWDDYPSDILIAGEGKQRGHEYFNKDSDALSAGDNFLVPIGMGYQWQTPNASKSFSALLHRPDRL